MGGETFYCRCHPNVVFRKIGLTNQFFNSQACEQAKLNNVELIDQAGLDSLIQQYPVTMLELERLLYADWNAES